MLSLASIVDRDGSRELSDSWLLLNKGLTTPVTAANMAELCEIAARSRTYTRYGSQDDPRQCLLVGYR